MLRLGDVVKGHFCDGDWYLGIIDQDNGDGTYTIAWLDGDTSNRVKRSGELKPMCFNQELQCYQEVEKEPNEDTGQLLEEVGRWLSSVDSLHGDGDGQDREQIQSVTQKEKEEANFGLPSTSSTSASKGPRDEAPCPSSSSTDVAVAPAKLAVGVRVRVVDEKPDSKINGLIGTLVNELIWDRWTVLLSDRTGTTKRPWVIDSKLLVPVPMSLYEPRTKYLIIGTFNDWTPEQMSWNSDQRCFLFRMQISEERGIESFQILLEGDWKRCIHPSFNNAGAKKGRWELCGPDEPSYEMNWTIAGPSGNRIEGAVYEIRLFLWEDETVSVVDWVEIEPSGSGRWAREEEEEQPQLQSS